MLQQILSMEVRKIRKHKQVIHITKRKYLNMHMFTYVRIKYKQPVKWLHRGVGVKLQSLRERKKTCSNLGSK
jgi:hypothetical protein